MDQSRGQKRKRGDSSHFKSGNGQSRNHQVNGEDNRFAPVKNGYTVRSLAEPPKIRLTPSPLSEKRKELLRSRADLPIWSHASEIRLGLQGSRDVMLLVGETGSGKSTQVPQFLLGESWCKGCIAITQPRRVAAISLARRVAEELGTPLGSSSPASKVGYSVRFDNNTSPSTKIKFLTEGMLLQEMLRDPWLKQYSAVIVDEVHERGVNVDLILGFLRNIVSGDKRGRRGVALKTVVMSATADTEALFNFFEDGFREKSRHAHTNGRISKPATENDGAYSDTSWSGLSSSEDEDKLGNTETINGHSEKRSTGINGATKNKEKINGEVLTPPTHDPNLESTKVEVFSDHITTCCIAGRQHPVEIMYIPEPTQDFTEAALKTIFQIHYKEPLPGDILVFLTGQDTVESLENLVNEYASAMGPEVPKLLVLPLFAALPRPAQQIVFARPPPKTRKLILSTNIAETSLTIPGVRHVIDCGLSKIKEYRPSLSLESLLVKPISQSAALQRKGRAGREGPGKCFRLYTEKDYLALAESNTPEILRCDLASSVLTMKARGVDDVLNFPFLDPPRTEALHKALLQLHRLSALDASGAITKTGLSMARLPLPPPLARVLLAAAHPSVDVLLPTIDIIACLSVETLFLNLALVSDDNKEAAETARRELYRRQGDHLTLLATVQAYAAEAVDRKRWAESHFVSHRALQSVMDVRKQLRAQCILQKLLNADEHQILLYDDGQSSSSSAQDEVQATKILKAFLTGFAPNTARLMPDGGYRTVEGNQQVSIHPSSVLFGKKVEAVMYNELVYTQKSYARGVSAVQMDWYGEAVGI